MSDRRATLKQPISASFQRGYVLVPGLALQSKSLAKAGKSLMTSEICSGCSFLRWDASELLQELLHERVQMTTL